MSTRDTAQGLHKDALNWDPRRQGSPIQQAHAAGDRAWSAMLDVAARTGQTSPLLRDPRDLAAHVGGLAQLASVEEFPSVEGWARVIAFALAGWCAASRCEELDVSAGGEA